MIRNELIFLPILFIYMNYSLSKMQSNKEDQSKTISDIQHKRDQEFLDQKDNMQKLHKLNEDQLCFIEANLAELRSEYNDG